LKGHFQSSFHYFPKTNITLSFLSSPSSLRFPKKLDFFGAAVGALLWGTGQQEIQVYGHHLFEEIWGKKHGEVVKW